MYQGIIQSDRIQNTEMTEKLRAEYCNSNDDDNDYNKAIYIIIIIMTVFMLTDVEKV